MGESHRIENKTISNIRWPWITFVVVLSYGFLLTNQSIGVDDENLEFAFKNASVVAGGRWGSWFLMHIVDTHSYLPVWRDVLAIVVLIVSSVLFVKNYEIVVEKQLNSIVVNLVVAIIISYSIVSKMFMYMSANLETALCIFCATVSCYVLLLERAGRIFSKSESLLAPHVAWTKRWGCLIVLFFLIVGCSMYENTLIYFGIEVCLFSFLQTQNDDFLKDIINPMILCVVAMVASKITGKLLADIIGVSYSQYSMLSYYKWSSINSLDDLKLALNDIIVNFKYWLTKYFSIRLYAITIVFWLGCTVVYARKKYYLKALYVLGMIISSFSMYIITANGGLPLRIFTHYFVTVAGMVLYVGAFLSNLQESRKTLFFQGVYVVCCFMCILLMTRETNEYYQLDYKRYLRDRDVARNVNYDLQKLIGITPDVPIIFIGQPEQYGDYSPEGEWQLLTIYSNNQQGESVRIHKFFSLLGYEYPDVIEGVTVKTVRDRTNSVLIAKALEEARGMNSYPYYGYISVHEDSIVIKLGEPD